MEHWRVRWALFGASATISRTVFDGTCHALHHEPRWKDEGFSEPVALSFALDFCLGPHDEWLGVTIKLHEIARLQWMDWFVVSPWHASIAVTRLFGTTLKEMKPSHYDKRLDLRRSNDELLRIIAININLTQSRTHFYSPSLFFRALKNCLISHAKTYPGTSNAQINKEGRCSADDITALCIWRNEVLG